jgi:mannosyltransferase
MIKNRERLYLGLIFLFCFVLRLAFITQKNLWFDEIFSWHLSTETFLDITWGTSADIHPPLYYYMLKIWMTAFGDSVFSIRLLSALLSSFSVFFIYPIARKILDAKESLVVLILYSISPLNLYYSQEARMAVLNLFLNTAALFFFFKTLEFKGRFTLFLKNINVWAYIIFTVFALYTHYFSFTFLAGEIIYLLISFKKLTRRIHQYLFIYILMFAAYLFWLPILMKHMTIRQPWRIPQNIFSLIEQLFFFFKDISLGLYHFYAEYRLMYAVNILILVLFSINVFGILYFLFKGIRTGKSKTSFPNYQAIIILVTFIPILAASVIFLGERIEFFRYLSFILPFILISGLMGLSNLNKKIQYTVIVIFAAVNIYGDYLYFKLDFKNNDYREVIKYLDSNSSGDEKLFVYPHYYGWIIDYYSKQDMLKIPKSADVRYGWGEYQDSIITHKPEKLWMVFDYGAEDTVSFQDKLNWLTYDYEITRKDSFQTVPFNVKVYKLKMK